jgi:hypothetical protein
MHLAANRYNVFDTLLVARLLDYWPLDTLSQGVTGLLSRSAPHAILASTRDIHKYIHSVLNLLALAKELAMVLMPCWLNRVRD